MSFLIQVRRLLKLSQGMIIYLFGAINYLTLQFSMKGFWKNLKQITNFPWGKKSKNLIFVSYAKFLAGGKKTPHPLLVKCLFPQYCYIVYCCGYNKFESSIYSVMTYNALDFTYMQILYFARGVCIINKNNVFHSFLSHV